MQKLLLVSSLLFSAFTAFSFPAFNQDSLKFGNNDFRRIEASPSVFLSRLPEKIDENSGLIFWRNALWTHNDSGGKPEIYKIDTAIGKITQTIYLEGIINEDWEDITQDDKSVFIGDFGNNGGDRKNLCIYKIQKSLIPLKDKVVSINPEKIAFSYADQTVFENKFRQNNFDCEAFFAFGDSLFLFTKNWGDGNTRLYVLPKITGQYQVSPRYTFPADGLVTGADINMTKTEIAFTGYKDFQSFMWIFWDFEGNDCFGGKKLRIDFPDLIFVQTEGIAYATNDDILFSCEKSIVEPGIFMVKSSQLKSLADEQDASKQPSKILISDISAIFSQKIVFDVLRLPDRKFSIELRDKRGERLFSEKYFMNDEKASMKIIIPTEKIKTGTYVMRIESGGQSLVRKIIIQN